MVTISSVFPPDNDLDDYLKGMLDAGFGPKEKRSLGMEQCVKCDALLPVNEGGETDDGWLCDSCLAEVEKLSNEGTPSPVPPEK